MPLSINTNIASMTAQRSFLNSNAALETAFERLSTGKRVNSAVDDAAGLSIGKAMEARVSGLNQAIRNVNDGISMVQIAEGALDEVTTILQKMRDLSVQASNDSLGTNERSYIDTEQSKLATALDESISQAKFNSTALFGTTATEQTTLSIQDGANNGETMSIVTDDLSAAILGVSGDDIILTNSTFKITGVTDALVAAEQSNSSTAFTLAIDYNAGSSFSDQSAVTLTVSGSTTEDVVAALNANSNSAISRYTFSVDGDNIVGTSDATGQHKIDSVTLAMGGTSVSKTATTITDAGTNYGIDAIDAAMVLIAEDRANLGATQSQLESTVRNLANVAENTAAAASRIIDTDYAAETANLTKAQILQQAATSVLAQANAQPQAVLALLQ